MGGSTTATPDGGASTWDGLARAFLVGLAIANAGFFHIAVVATPGLDPPPETAAVFLVATAAAATSYVLLARGLLELGYLAAILSGAYVLVSAVLVVAGIYGPPGPETNPLGPIAWVLLALAVVASAWLARRDHESGT